MVRIKQNEESYYCGVSGCDYFLCIKCGASPVPIKENKFAPLQKELTEEFKNFYVLGQK